MQVDEHNTSHGRGRESIHGNSLPLRGRGQIPNLIISPSSPMQTVGRGQASTQASESSPIINF